MAQRPSPSRRAEAWRRVFLMDSSVAPRGEGTLQLRGLDICFEVLGKVAGGVPIVLTPGGGGGKGGLRWLAQRLRGTRQCLIWGARRRHGTPSRRCLLALTHASSVLLPFRPTKLRRVGADTRRHAAAARARLAGALVACLCTRAVSSHCSLQADYLHLLLHSLGMAPAILLGKSNGARLSLIMAAKYPEDVAGIVLLNVTNGTKAAKRLSQERYYTALDACAKGGIEAVASLPRYKELCSKNPENSLKLAAMDPARFMAQHKCWGDFLARGGSPAEFPVTGLHADFLKRVKQPALCIYLVAEGGKDDVRIAATLLLSRLSRRCAQGMHTVDAIRALHASLPAAVGSDPVVAADSAKDQWVAAIEAFAATIPCSLAPPQSPSFASQQAPLKPLAGAYPHMPSAQEVQQFESYYLKVAADNAVEAERERNAACACTGLRAWLPTGWRASR